jgi:hypothetical protein
MGTIAKIQKSINHIVSMILMYFLHPQKANCPSFKQASPFLYLKKYYSTFFVFKICMKTYQCDVHIRSP